MWPTRARTRLKLGLNYRHLHANHTASSVVPVGVAVDAAGDIYVQDETSASVIEVPVSGTETPVLTGLQSNGVAVDGLATYTVPMRTIPALCKWSATPAPTAPTRRQ